jgi:glycosyltransferase involved in cell wall biosynthesis
MNILHISPSYKPAFIYGGPTVSISKLCEALSKSKVTSTIITTTANGTSNLIVKTNIPIIVDGVTVYYHKSLWGDPIHFSPSLLWSLLIKHLNSGGKPLVIHIHSWWNLTAMLSCLVALLMKFPVIISPKGMLTDYTFNNRNRLSKYFIHHCFAKHMLKRCHIHASTDKEKLDIMKLLPSKITIISNIIQLPKSIFNPLKPNLRQNSKSQTYNDKFRCFKVLFLSRIEEKKGIEIILEALSQVKFNWTLTIAGSGSIHYIRKIKELTGQLGIVNCVNWVGQVDIEHKFALLKRHDLLVLPSHNESFGNVVIESLAAGTAVIISDKVGLARYVMEKDLGWVSELTIGGFKSSLNQASHQEEKRKRIRLRAPILISTDYNENIIIEQYITMYKSILSNE